MAWPQPFSVVAFDNKTQVRAYSTDSDGNILEWAAKSLGSWSDYKKLGFTAPVGVALNVTSWQSQIGPVTIYITWINEDGSASSVTWDDNNGWQKH